MDILENNTINEILFHNVKDNAIVQTEIERLKRVSITKPIILIGAGTCGLGAGAGKTIKAVKNYVAHMNYNIDIIEVGCIGCCFMEPLMDIQVPGMNRISFGFATEDKVENILKNILNHKLPEYEPLYQMYDGVNKDWDNVPFMRDIPFFARQERWVLPNCGIINPENIDEYIARDGYKALVKVLSEKTGEEICEDIIKSGLRGRGGGGFTTGLKWKLARESIGDQKYLICNADEGDPGAFMDRAVIEGDPHRLLEGIAIASYAFGASKAYIYIRAEYPLAIERLKKPLQMQNNINLLERI